MGPALTLVVCISTIDSCCLSLCDESPCHGCSKTECLAGSECRFWSCGTFDEGNQDADDCLFYASSVCSPGGPFGSACLDTDGAPSVSYCEDMPPLGQRPTWVTSETSICARRRDGRGRCKGAMHSNTRL